MNNKEKIIQGLEIQLDDLQKYANENEMLSLTQERAKEIVSILKEQNAVEPTFKQGEDGIFVWCCGLCGAYMYHIYDGIDKAKEYAKYCRQCGKAVKWE